MYDPARNVFTQSDEMVPVTVSDDHSVNQEADAPRESEQACLTTGSQQVHVPVSLLCFLLAWLHFLHMPRHLITTSVPR